MQGRIFLSLVLLVSVSCAVTRGPSSSSDSAQRQEAEPSKLGNEFTTVLFQNGTANLSRMSRTNLKKIAAEINRAKIPVDEIRIMAWGDTEYPDKVEGNVSEKEVELAGKRASVVNDFLKDHLKRNEDIDSFNMAQRPDLLSKLFRNDEYKVKEAFESTGVTGNKLPDGSVSYTKASKAIVIIDYEGRKDNL